MPTPSPGAEDRSFLIIVYAPAGARLRLPPAGPGRLLESVPDAQRHEPSPRAVDRLQATEAVRAHTASVASARRLRVDRDSALTGPVGRD
jgi:hypothetical protein